MINKKTMIKSKKAGIFAAGMILAMLIFMTTAWFAFSTTNKKITAEINTLPVLNSYYNEQDRFYLYAQESQKLAVSQAFYQIAKDAAINPAKESCNLLNNYIIWNENCNPNTDMIKERFLENYNQTLANLIKLYPNDNMRPEYVNEINENNWIASTAQPITLNSEKQGSFAKYNFSYSFSPSIKLNLTEQDIYLEDFKMIYNKFDSCNKELECIKAISLKHWKITVEEYSSYILLKLKTKKAFFFQENGVEKYAPIELNFIIEK